MNLGIKIINLRKENNLTQDELAEMLNVSRQTISNWENGKSYPDIATLIMISNKFKISLDVLLKDEKMVKAIDNKIKSNGIFKYIILCLSIIIIFIGGVFIVKKYSFNYASEPIFKNDIKLEDITRSDDNLIMSINKFNSKCVNVHLDIYNDGTYKIYDSYIIPDTNPIDTVLIWDDPQTFTYNYDVLEILKSMKKYNKEEYEIRLGNGEVYFTDTDNQALRDFLEKENINLNKCGKAITRKVQNGLYHLLNNIYSDEINPKLVYNGEMISITNFLSKTNCTYECIFNYEEPMEIKDNIKIYSYEVISDKYYLIACDNIYIGKDKDKLINYCQKN